MENSPAENLLPENWKAHLEKEGYLITPPLFATATLQELGAAFHKIWAAHLAALPPDDEQQLAQARNRPFLADLHKIDPVCLSICTHPTLLHLVQQILGADFDLSWNQAILKPPHAGNNAFAWHQDQWYALKSVYADHCDRALLAEPDSGITLWLAVSRTTVENGTLWVLPGRHREGLLPHVFDEERNDWKGQYDTSAGIPAVLEPGQCLVFKKYLPHGSGANTSDEIRMAYQIGYSLPGMLLPSSPHGMPVVRQGNPVA